jgi:starch-binding outer membrane protein, SusD/RagB family
MNIVNNDDRRPRGRFLPRLALLLGVLIPLGACDLGSVLEVQQPDVITPVDLTGAPGINAFFAGAIGDFTVAHQGGGGGGSFMDGYVTSSAYLSDEGYAAGTFPQRQEWSQRSIDERNPTLLNVYRRMHRARRSSEVAAGILRDANPADRRIGEMLALASVMYNNFGEGFCSGVPVSQAPLGGDLTYGDPLTTQQIFERASARADEALAAAPAGDSARHLASVQKGRALLNLGRYADAAAAVQGVPTSFRYRMTHTLASARAENGWFNANEWTRRLGVADYKGGPAAPWAAATATPGTAGEGLNYVSANDPRVPTKNIPGAFDAVLVPFTVALTGWPQYGINLGRNAPFPVAGGIEARLIEAEAALQGGNAAGALTILNTLRADFPALGLAPLTGTATRDVLFRERAFWLYAQGRRLGDMRRLVRQYGLPQSQVFPTGTYYKHGAAYGSDVNFPIPEQEVNNPNFNACLNRDA